MKFEEALVLLRNGKAIRRKEWENGLYICYNGYCFSYYYPNPFNGEIIEERVETINMTLLLADDWEEQ